MYIMYEILLKVALNTITLTLYHVIFYNLLIYQIDFHIINVYTMHTIVYMPYVFNRSTLPI
jgi:hypothetical protein